MESNDRRNMHLMESGAVDRYNVYVGDFHTQNVQVRVYATSKPSY